MASGATGEPPALADRAVTPPKTEGARRLEFIDGLRGAAILIVVLGHYYVRAYEVGLPRWADLLGFGYLGVHLFLILSGFCVSWAYVGPSARPFALADFASRRALRILPAYYVALVMAAYLNGSDLGHSELAWQVLTHLSMLHNLFPSTVLGLNAPFWSLALECQLYLCFPLMLWGTRRWGLGVTLGLVVLAQTTFRLAILRYGTGYNDTTFVLPWGVLGRLSEFAFGMTGAMIVSHGSMQRAPSLFRSLLPLGILVLFLCARWSKVHLGISHPLTDAAWSAGFFCVLICASQTGTVSHRVFSQRWLVNLGVFSYSVYLVHELLLSRIMSRLLMTPMFRAHPLAFMPVVLVPTFAAGYAFYRLIERPAIELFARRRRARHPANA